MNAIDFFKKEDPANNDEYSKDMTNWFYDRNDMVMFAERYHQAKLKLLDIANGEGRNEMKKEINDLLLKLQNGKNCIGETANQLLDLSAVSGSLQYSEREVDFAYLCGVFNTSGIDGLYGEIQRLKELGKKPHDIVEACRKQ